MAVEMMNEKRGRKPLETGKRMVQRMVTMDDESAEILKAFGNGNLSHGIREAAKAIWSKQLESSEVSQ